MSYENSVIVKIVGSGLKVTMVPVFGLSPTTFSGSLVTPAANSSSCTLPSRQISRRSHSLTALTALTPTPWRPDDIA